MSLLASGAGFRHGGVVKEEPPVRTKARRLGKLRWWLLALFLAWGGYLAWREYDYRAAVREAKEAGFEWRNVGPWDLIRQDWHSALKKETWSTYVRFLGIDRVHSLTQHRNLIRRLRPKVLQAWGCKDGNLNALKGVTSLEKLDIQSCPELQSLEALRGLSGLKRLELSNCPKLQNLDGLSGLTGLKYLALSDCLHLQNVDALKSLAGLQNLYINGYQKIPLNSFYELSAALPHTEILFPDGSESPPK